MMRYVEIEYEYSSSHADHTVDMLLSMMSLFSPDLLT